MNSQTEFYLKLKVASNAKIYSRVQMFCDKSKIKQIEKKIEIKLKEENIQEENYQKLKEDKLDMNTITPENIESPTPNNETPSVEKKEMINIDNNLEQNKKIEESLKDQKETNAIMCIIEIRNFFDFVMNLFKMYILIPHSNIVVIVVNKLLIYEEYFDEWAKINIEELFEICSIQYSNNNKNIFDFTNCFSFVTSFDLAELNGFVSYEVDQLKLIFSDKELVMTLFDDLSFVKIKRSIYPFLKQNSLNVKDDYNDDIN